ncbi:hypothetical protein CLM84_10355 [Streptomyces albidoflavus]|nr:hypothetical protein CLM84_10355 [Streptomyces albidoflavus]
MPRSQIYLALQECRKERPRFGTLRKLTPAARASTRSTANPALHLTGLLTGVCLLLNLADSAHRTHAFLSGTTG